MVIISKKIGHINLKKISIQNIICSSGKQLEIENEIKKRDDYHFIKKKN